MAIDAMTFKLLFRSKICKVCGLCGEKYVSPEFCITMYGNKDRFFNILKYIIAYKETNQNNYENLFHFKHFCELFCNSKPVCPVKNNTCDFVINHISCYRKFSLQRGVIVREDTITSLFKTYSISDNKINSTIIFGDPLKGFKKSARSRTKSIVKKARKDLEKSALKLAMNDRVRATKYKKSKIVTTSFCSDDDGWKSQIAKYLEA